ncbi:MAG: tripartite tricarboxylate transporter substrate binding protein [Proteobacteria bacterium]|nr:tripartite tricarboxylate transporter substrate binding protein [Pseudomonadota bacterium]
MKTNGTGARRRTLLRGAAALALVPAAARADDPLRLVVGFPPGGGLDAIGRALANALREPLGRPAIVVNQPGAGSLVAAQAVARGRPDGSTWLLAPVVVPAFFPWTHDKLGFDPMTDLVPVAMIGTFPFALVVGPAVPARTVAEFVAWAKANTGKLAFGSLGAGTPSHFLGVMFDRAAGTGLLHAPYAGAAPVLMALQSGEIQAAFVVAGSAAELHKANKVRVLAVFGPQRAASLPDVPATRELGPALKALEDASLWYGVFAPRGTPDGDLDRFNAAVGAALATAAVRDVCAREEVTPQPMSRAAFAALVARDNAAWGEVIRSTGFKATQ